MPWQPVAFAAVGFFTAILAAVELSHGRWLLVGVNLVTTAVNLCGLWRCTERRRRPAMVFLPVDIARGAMVEAPTTGRAHPGEFLADYAGSHAKAEELLQRLLTPEQRCEYRHRGMISVQTALASYRLRPGERVMATRDGRVHQVCVVYLEHELWCPEADRLLAILLMLRTDEEGFWERFCPHHMMVPEQLQPQYPHFGPRGGGAHRHHTVACSAPVPLAEDLRPRVLPRGMP